MSWDARDDREWRDEGIHTLARSRAKRPQAGPSLPRVIEDISPERYVCRACGRDTEWPAWVTAGGVDGPLTCPSCGEES